MYVDMCVDLCPDIRADICADKKNERLGTEHALRRVVLCITHDALNKVGWVLSFAELELHVADLVSADNSDRASGQHNATKRRV